MIEPAKDLLSKPEEKSLATSINERESQELVIALVGPVGSGVSTSARLLKELLQIEFGYDVPEILKQSDIIKREAARVGMGKIPASPLSVYIDQMQNAGNLLRKKFGPNYLAEKTVEQIVKYRTAKGAVVDGKLKITLDTTYPFANISETLAYVESGRAKGKVVVTMS